MPKDYPQEDEILATGTIGWSRLTRQVTGRGSMFLVPVVCGKCGKERLSQAPSVLSGLRLGKGTARCRTCAPLLRRERRLARYRLRGRESLPDGTVIDWTSIIAPPDGRSGESYKVDAICRCGYRRRISVAKYSVGKTVGLCRSCTKSLATAGTNNPRWHGGSTSRGYRIVRIPPDHPMICMAEVHTISGWGRVLEHRLVAATQRGTPLEPWEHVHHINQDRQDNRPENLQVVRPAEHATITAMEREIKRLRLELAALRQRTGTIPA